MLFAFSAVKSSAFTTALYQATDFTGSSNNLPVTFVPVNPNVIETTNGFRLPIEVDATPTNGSFTVVLLPVDYTVSIQGLTTTFVVSIPDTNTVVNLWTCVNPSNGLSSGLTWQQAANALYLQFSNTLAGQGILVGLTNGVITISTNGGPVNINPNAYLATSGGIGTNNTFHGLTLFDDLEGGYLAASVFTPTKTVARIAGPATNSGYTNNLLDVFVGGLNGTWVAGIDHLGNWLGNGSLLGGIFPATTFSTYLNSNKVLYISASGGNDATAIRGDPSHPWANFYTYTYDGVSATNRGGVMVAATNGDTVIVLPGNYSVPLIPMNAGVTLQGVGNPVITHNTNMTVNGTNYLVNQTTVGNWMNPGNNCIMRGLTLVFSNTNIFDSVWGNYFSQINGNLAWTNANFTNAIMENCFLFGNTDCILSAASTGCQYVLRNDYLQTAWDAVNTAAGDTALFEGCTIISTGNSLLGNGSARPVTVNGVLKDIGSTYSFTTTNSNAPNLQCLTLSGGAASVQLVGTTLINNGFKASGNANGNIVNVFGDPVSGTWMDGTNGIHLLSSMFLDGPFVSVGGLTANATNTHLIINDAGASHVVITDAATNSTNSITTTAELAFVHGVTSAIQTQLNAKGAGTVTSVGLAGDNVLFPTTASGSPVTSSGAFTLTPLTQNSNTFYRGPNSGSAATPFFGPLVNADFPATLAPAFSAVNLTSIPSSSNYILLSSGTYSNTNNAGIGGTLTLTGQLIETRSIE